MFVVEVRVVDCPNAGHMRKWRKRNGRSSLECGAQSPSQLGDTCPVLHTMAGWRWSGRVNSWRRRSTEVAGLARRRRNGHRGGVWEKEIRGRPPPLPCHCPAITATYAESAESA
ncbi:hypothetical protein NDU88_005725 [Pleurodeles waltl]|uniref:Uncharacterized protein n=1 Tax=Pleurodeles waltl TaxID=8319 RepID=A0AAV7MBV8_PLEWA|nr:hypothetical protein NDU88_005725 [Pleurodeles waltl]